MRYLLLVLLASSLLGTRGPIPLTETGSLLYYNTPAAVADGGTTFAGWIEKDGSVITSKIEGRSVERSTIHKYDIGDDHAAPALTLNGDHLWVATAKHSSDLFVYRVSKDELEPTLHCRIAGKFTYPRWVGSQLLIRHETDLPSGDLAISDVNKDGCHAPKTVIQAKRNEYIYATPPALVNEHLWVAYSIYSLIDRRHEGVFVKDLTAGRTITIRHPRATGPELLAWSVTKGRVGFVEFTGTMECCSRGVMRLIGTDMDGAVISEGSDGPMPYYPSISDASCSLGGTRYMSQRFAGGYIASEITGPEHNIRSFQSRVFLCPN